MKYKIISNDGRYIILISVNGYLVNVISSLGLKVSVVIFLEESLECVTTQTAHFDCKTALVVLPLCHSY